METPKKTERTVQLDCPSCISRLKVVLEGIEGSPRPQSWNCPVCRRPQSTVIDGKIKWVQAVPAP